MSLATNGSSSVSWDLKGCRLVIMSHLQTHPCVQCVPPGAMGRWQPGADLAGSAGRDMWHREPSYPAAASVLTQLLWAAVWQLLSMHAACDPAVPPVGDQRMQT